MSQNDDNRRQSWTVVDKYLMLSPHLDFPNAREQYRSVALNTLKKGKDVVGETKGEL